MAFALALIGVLPVLAGFLIRTPWVSERVARETRGALERLGVHARFDVDVRLWPLSVSVRNVRIESSDGGAPFVTANRATVRPRILGLLSGKLGIDQIEVERPSVRVVLERGELKNLALNLPKGEGKSEPPRRPPFNVASISAAELDLTIDGHHVVAREIDADVTVEDDPLNTYALELALRIAEVKSTVVRANPRASVPSALAFDDDTACRIDGRARIAGRRARIYRLEAYGAADMDAARGTHVGCDVSKTDPRYVELALGHLGVVLSDQQGVAPIVDGHVKVRAPIPLVGRLGASAPITEGWVGVDVELRHEPSVVVPNLEGTFEAHDLRVARFNFAKKLEGDVRVQQGVVRVPRIRLDIAESATEIQGIEVRPFDPGIPISVANLDIANANFNTLLRDFRVHPTSYVAWDIREVHVANVAGTAVPLKLDGDIRGHTYDFAVFDRPATEPIKKRVFGVRDASLRGKLAIRPKGFEFQSMTVSTPRSVVRDVLVGIGYHEELRIEVGGGSLDLADVSPLGNVAMAGTMNPKVSVTGTAGTPVLRGETSIRNFVIGDIPFGDVTQAHVVSDISNLTVDLSDVRAQKGKSAYEMTSGRLDFNAPSDMRLDGQVSSKALSVRDFFSMFHIDEDPRFDAFDGTLETQARVHIALGGPEDPCRGGYVSVAASTHGRALKLLGERFDEGSADFEYRWLDRLAGVEGAEVDVRSLALMKHKREGRALGTVLGSMTVRRGGDMRGNLVVQGMPLNRVDFLGPAAKLVDGTASGVARIGGTTSAFEIDADVSVTPLRILGAAFGGSDLHVFMNQKAKVEKPIGKTACGAPVMPPFDKTAFAKDESSQGEVRLDGTFFGGQVRVTELVSSRQKLPVVTGSLVFDRLDIGPLAKMTRATEESESAAGPTVGGELSGELKLERVSMGDLARAKARFSPTAIRLHRGSQRLSLRTDDASLVLSDDTLTIPKLTFEIESPSGLRGSLAGGGSVRHLTRGAELALDAELFPIDLGVLAGSIPKLARAAGTLKGRVSLTGAVTEPSVDGAFSVRGGELAIKGLPGGITDVDVDIEADENQARITRASGHFLGGDVSATAEMDLRRNQLGIVNARILGKQLSVAPAEGVRAVIDANLEVSLNPNASTAQGKLPFVGGDIDITQFDYTRPVTVDLSGLKGGASRTVVESYDPTADALVLGVDLRARAPLYVHNNLVDTKLVIDPRGIHVSGTNQRFGLRGELSTLPGGRFRVFANDFEIQKGSIVFSDPTRIAPSVDVTGVTEYRRYSNTVASPGSSTGGAGAAGGGGVTTGNISSGGRGGGLWRIALHAHGDADDVRVDMTSDPALSREDIFFLLTIGLTRAEVDQVRAGSVYASAAFEAIGTVTGADRAVKTALPVIDDFRFGSAYSPRSGRTEPQVTLGRRLTDNVRANVSTGLTEDRQLRSNIEWRLSRPLSVQTSYDNINTVSSGSLGNFGLDLRWRVEFE